MTSDFSWHAANGAGVEMRNRRINRDAVRSAPAKMGTPGVRVNDRTAREVQFSMTATTPGAAERRYFTENNGTIARIGPSAFVNCVN
jgi:hypothetical protein